MNAFKDPTTTQASGIRLAGQKFFTLQANDRSVYGKKGVRHSFPSCPRTILLTPGSLFLSYPRVTAACSSRRSRPSLWRSTLHLPRLVKQHRSSRTSPII